MTEYRSEFVDALVARGLLHQCTDLAGLDRLAAKDSLVAYIGFDCTADSLHVGSLVPIMLLRLLQRTGHKPIVLLGGGTTKVGDPAGRDEIRRLLDDREIERNMAGIKRVFSRFLAVGEGSTDALIVNNAEWLEGLGYIGFLRDYGRHFSVNRMLTFDSVKLRLERRHPLSFLEFNYMVLQAYDFLELFRRHGCTLQMGGSDQWGNIVNGVELIRRLEGGTVYGLTAPLIETASGEKMGKTARGAVWLNEERLTPHEYYQYWRNAADADVGRFLRLFTDLPLDEVRRLEALSGTEANEAKKRLAFEATRLCHGEEKARLAEKTARLVFEEGVSGIVERTVEAEPASTGGFVGTVPITPVTGLPMLEVTRRELRSGIPAFELFRRANLAPSNSEARHLIRGGGGRINDAVVRTETRMVTLDDVDEDGVIKLSAGKKRHALVRPVDTVEIEVEAEAKSTD